MEVPEESFHWSSWDSRTCYPRRAFIQGLTDDRFWNPRWAPMIDSLVFSFPFFHYIKSHLCLDFRRCNERKGKKGKYKKSYPHGWAERKYTTKMKGNRCILVVILFSLFGPPWDIVWDVVTERQTRRRKKINEEEFWRRVCLSFTNIFPTACSWNRLSFIIWKDYPRFSRNGRGLVLSGIIFWKDTREIWREYQMEGRKDILPSSKLILTFVEHRLTNLNKGFNFEIEDKISIQH